MLEWRIIFVDEDDNLQARLFVSRRNDGIKAVGKLGGLVVYYPLGNFKIGETVPWR